MVKSFEAKIDTFRSSLAPETLHIVDALRTLIIRVDSRLVEEFKWNAPSFRLGDEHRITLGLERNGSVRLVLHRGVSRKDNANFEFQDPLKLAVWPARDRGVLKLKSFEELTSIAEPLTELAARWLAIPG